MAIFISNSVSVLYFGDAPKCLIVPAVLVTKLLQTKEIPVSVKKFLFKNMLKAKWNYTITACQK